MRLANQLFEQRREEHRNERCHCRISFAEVRVGVLSCIYLVLRIGPPNSACGKVCAVKFGDQGEGVLLQVRSLESRGTAPKIISGAWSWQGGAVGL